METGDVGYDGVDGGVFKLLNDLVDGADQLVEGGIVASDGDFELEDNLVDSSFDVRDQSAQISTNRAKEVTESGTEEITENTVGAQEVAEKAIEETLTGIATEETAEEATSSSTEETANEAGVAASSSSDVGEVGDGGEGNMETSDVGDDLVDGGVLNLLNEVVDSVDQLVEEGIVTSDGDFNLEYCCVDGVFYLSDQSAHIST